MSIAWPSRAMARASSAAAVRLAEVGAVRGERAARRLDARARLGLAVRRGSRLVPTMSAPATRERLRHRETDAAAAAGDERDLAGQVEHQRSRSRARIFIDSPASIARNASATPSSGTTSVISVSRGIAPSASSAHRLFVVGALVDARADQRRAPARRRGTDRPAAAWRGCRRRRRAPARRGSRSRSPCPPAVPETSNATSAPASVRPLVDPGRRVLRRAGRRRDEPERLDDARGDARSARTPRPRAPADARDRRDQQPDRAGTDHDGVLAAARARSAARRARRPRSARPALPSAATASAGSRTSTSAGHVPARLHRARRVDAEEDRGGSRCAHAPLRARGAGPARDERHDGRCVAGRPALDAVADRRDAARPSRGRARRASSRARPSRRGGCAGRCRRSRCRRPSSWTSPAAGGAGSVSTTSSVPLPM